MSRLTNWSLPFTAASAFALALLLFLLTMPGMAQEVPPVPDEPVAVSATADSKNFQLLGVYTGTKGYVGPPINATVSTAYVYFDSGLQVLNISNPAAVQHLGGAGHTSGRYQRH